MANAQTYQSEFTGPQMDQRFAAVAELQTAITELQTAVAAKYSKPSAGIPSTDLDADVNAALAKANSAVQSLADYYTKAEVDDIAAAIAASVDSTSGVVVTSLPSAGAGTLGKIYYVGPDADGFYDRYVTSYDGSTYSWLALGNTEVDMTQYATVEQLNQLDQEVNGKPENGYTYELTVSSGTSIARNVFHNLEFPLLANKTYRIDFSGQKSSVSQIRLYADDGSGSYATCLWNEGRGTEKTGSSFDFTPSDTSVTIKPSVNVTRIAFYLTTQQAISSGTLEFTFVDPAVAGIVDDIADLQSSLAEIGEELIITNNNTPVSADSALDGKYIDSDGELSSFRDYRCDVYDVERAGKVHLTIAKGQDLASRQYAFYSATADFASGNCLSVGPVVDQSMSSGTTDINVPAGAKRMLVVNYSNVVTQTMTADVSTPVKEVVQKLDAEASRLLAVKYDGENLYAAYIDGAVEYCYWFKKCLANDLFSFYLVGYRATTRTVPSADGITESGITQLNKASSDNIGPVSMSVGGYVGGNHLYNGTVKTAKTDSVAVFVDGRSISSGFLGYAKSLAIKVVNTVYDPSVAPAAGAEILTTPLYTEFVDYRVEKNNIEVGVALQFVPNAPNSLANYYGMQSSFVSETGVMTPNGALASAFSLPSTDSFTKGAYPNFNRFIEKKSEGYQATYLIPNKAGDHSMIADADEIFSRGNTKDYHQVAIGGTVAGRRITWSGVYTFCASVLEDDASVLAYMGVVNGKDAIFIAAKAACEVNVPIPSAFLFKPCEIVEKVGSIDTDNTFVDADGIRITATGTGSLILSIQ